MINSITFSKKTMATHGTLAISIPPEIIGDMELSDSEMVEVVLTKKQHVKPLSVPEQITNLINVYIPSDFEAMETFR